jgi:hypothetical protein
MRFIAFLFAFLMVGCGGSQLTPKQQSEFDALGTKSSELRSRLGKESSKTESMFRRLGKLEAKEKAVAKTSLGCGVDAAKNRIGPLPFVHKKGYRVKLSPGSKRTVGGQKCVEYTLKVVK